MIKLDVIQTDHELQYVEVTENVIIAAIYPYEVDKLLRKFETATMSCIALPEGLIFIDCGSRTDLAQKFRGDMETRFERKTTHLFLTHNHWDHIFGMGVFEDVDIVMSGIGMSYLRRNIKNRTYNRYKREIQRDYIDNEKLCESVENTALSIPNISVPRERKFGSNSSELIFTVIGGHTKPSATIYYPSREILFTGDNLVSCYMPAIWDISIIDTYNKWLKMDIRYFIPGHGPIINKDYVKRIKIYFEQLLSVLRELRDQGVSKSKVLRHPDLPEYPGKHQRSWIKGSEYHSARLRTFIKSWYGQVLKEAINEDEMSFIS